MAKRETLNRRSDSGGRSSGKFNTHRRPEAVRKRAEQTGGRFDSFLKQGVDMFRPKAGLNTIRYLPPRWENPEHYGYDIWLHSYVGVEESSYLCPAKMLNKPCAICEAAKAAKDAGDKEEYDGLKASNRVLVYVLDRDEKISKDGIPTPLIYNQSWSFDRDITALADNPKSGALYIDDEEEGYDVTFTRKGQGLNTRYIGTAIDREPSPICEDQKDQDEVLALILENPIPDMLKFYPNEHLRKVIEGTSESKDEDLDKDEEPRGGRDRGRGRSRDEDENDEVERDEAPRSRRSSRDEEEEPKRGSRERVRPSARSRDEEEEEPRGRTHRGRDDRREDEEEERPGRGSRERTSSRRDEEDEERPRTRERTKPRNDEEEDRPSRGRRAANDDEEGERSSRRGRESRDVEDEKPRERRGSRSSRDEADEPEPDEAEGATEADEEDERPRRRAGRR